MDGKQGIQLVQLISPKLTIPVHFDDYDVFLVSQHVIPYLIMVRKRNAETGLSDLGSSVTSLGFRKGSNKGRLGFQSSVLGAR